MSPEERAADPAPTVAVLDAYVAHNRERYLIVLRARMGLAWQRRTEAEGLLNEAHHDANRRWHQYLANQRGLRSWFYRILRDRLADDYGFNTAEMRDFRQEVQPLAREADASGSQDAVNRIEGGTDPAVRVEAEEQQALLAQQLQRAMSQIDEVARELLVLTALAGFNQREAAEMVEMKYAAARQCLVRARAELRGILTTMDGFEGFPK